MVHSFDDMSEVIQKITNMYGNSTSPASQENSAAPAPISQDLENLTYNLSEKHQKKVEFYSTGNALTCVPGRYQRKVRDILIQLIRNSVAHGIEQPQVRTQSGKPEEGRIHLEVREEKNWVRVIYSDDGSGLNYQKIIARAKKLDQEQPGLLQTLIHKNEWNLEKVNDLVFLPGFSTKEEADKDSGRGVGLDVVRKMVNDMKGQISLQTEQGEYCAFIIDLPLTEKAL